jgi:hypothetical protein
MPAITSVQASWVTDSMLHLQIGFDTGEVETTSVLVPPPPSPVGYLSMTEPPDYGYDDVPPDDD